MEDINTFLKSTKLLYNFTPDEIYLISQFTKIVEFTANTTLIHQGKSIEGLYTVISGEIEVVVRLPGDRKIKLATLSTGSFFGDISLISDGVATASIITIATTRCALLTKEVFHSLQILYPELAYKLLLAINSQVCKRIKDGIKRIAGFLDDISAREHLSNRELMSGISIYEESLANEHIPLPLLLKLTAFQNLTQEQLKKLFSYLVMLKLPNNYEILSEHEKADTNLYIIIQGAVGTTTSQNHKITKLGVLGPGSMIIPRYKPHGFADSLYLPITYVTREQTVLFKMTVDQLTELFKVNKPLYYQWHMAISLGLVSLLTAINKQLIRYQSEFPSESFFATTKT